MDFVYRAGRDLVQFSPKRVQKKRKSNCQAQVQVQSEAERHTHTHRRHRRQCHIINNVVETSQTRASTMYD